jgi:hypothetical protein
VLRRGDETKRAGALKAAFLHAIGGNGTVEEEHMHEFRSLSQV